MRKIRPGGAIAFNVTNRYVDLEPVLADLARTIEVAAAIRSDDVISAEDRSRYDKRYSVWVVVSQSEADLAELYARPDWRQLSTRSDVQYWTDEYSNIVTVLR
jgi:hypothetical protein